LPLFLEMVRQISRRDPALARQALAGLDAYARASRPPARADRPAIARVGGAALRDHGGDGAPTVLIPSLINPPDILDLDDEVSLAGALQASSRQVLLVDWGPASARSGLGIDGHIEMLLLPLLDALGEPADVVGYCLGGTMAIAAAHLVPVRRLATLAAPWHFTRYPPESRKSLGRLWQQSEAPSEQLGTLPMEVLQAGFWALDPERTVRKFAEFGTLDPASDQALRFVTLEDWANEGEPLPLPAARELFEAMYRDDLPGSARWHVAGKRIDGRAPAPTLHLVAGNDRIVPAASAPDGEQVMIPSGHVGMIVGRSRTVLHESLRRFLAS
jgi:polyhydroxyalkanoate synthase subunit PhaC